MMFRVMLACLVISGGTTAAADRTRDYLKRADAWFSSDEGREQMENLLSHQSEAGCWPKNIDTTAKPFQGQRNEIDGTYDNGATVSELRLLGRAYQLTANDNYKQAFDRGIQCILSSQYSNGGWPQKPRGSGYSQHITYNDKAMVELMTLLRDVAHQDHYDFVAEQTRQQAQAAFDRGVKCMLDSQIIVNGKLTVWCAQHDQETLAPRGARAYEHPSLSGAESAGVLLLLMSLDNPSKQVRDSIRAGAEWFARSGITGIRFDEVNGDRQVIDDPTAPTLWARFYDIETNRPIFSGRDGIIKFDVAEIEAERRNGYAWYVDAGAKVAKAWKKWQHTL